MRVIWTPEAAQDRTDIWDYLSAVNPKAAIEMDKRFSDSLSLLTQHPEIGPIGMVAAWLQTIRGQARSHRNCAILVGAGLPAKTD